MYEGPNAAIGLWEMNVSGILGKSSNVYCGNGFRNPTAVVNPPFILLHQMGILVLFLILFNSFWQFSTNLFAFIWKGKFDEKTSLIGSAFFRNITGRCKATASAIPPDISIVSVPNPAVAVLTSIVNGGPRASLSCFSTCFHVC